MTTEQAIKLIHRLQDEQFDGIHGDERREALEMAVRALEGDGDTISRKMAIDAVVSAMIDGADAELVEGIMELLPSAQPETPCYLGSPCEYQNKDIKLPSAQPDIDEWCPDCKEYDSKRHCCPRLNRVIRTMLKDSHVIPERKKGRWILSDDREWKTCSECGADVDVSMGSGVYVGVDAVSEMNFCPNCGADMRGEDK